MLVGYARPPRPRPLLFPAATRVLGRADRATLLWLLAALAQTLVYVAWTMGPGFAPGDVVQDDVRQHVFWMQRFRDPELFRSDPIADYFQSVAPLGYTALYRVLGLALDPLLASRLLPPLLGLVAALFTFLTVRWLHPSPVAAFAATALLSRFAWQHGAMSSATPRAFLLPLLCVLLWAVVSRRRAVAAGVTGLAAALYPTAALIGLGLLGSRLVSVRGFRPAMVRDRADWLAFAAALALAAAILVPGQLATAPWGPTVAADQARAMPEFGEDGRSAFFVPDWYTYWVRANRSGLDLAVVDARNRAIPILYEHAAAATLLPLALLFRRRLPAARRLSGRTIVLAQLLAVSFGLFFLAHLLLFQLYLPGRYVKWGLPLVLSIAAGLGLAILGEEVARRVRRPLRPAIVAALGLGCGLVLLAYPGRWQGKFLPDPNPALTAYLRSQPKDILIAGTPSEADFVPTLTGRSVLASREYALPYHLTYYAGVQRRIFDLIEAYYADSPERIVEVADRYGVGLFLVNRSAFDPRRFTDAWGSDFEPYASAIRAKLAGRGRYALLDAAKRCGAAEVGDVIAVPTDCLRRLR